MAQFPYLAQFGFELNALGGDLAETDTASAGAIYHYTDLVSTHGFTPWRGAYCYVIDQSVALTTECKLISGGCNVTAANYWAMGFAFYAKSTAMTAGDRTPIVKLLAGATCEVCLQLYYTAAAGVQLLLTEAEGTTVGTNPAWPLAEDMWHWIELYGANDLGSNNGTAYLVVDGLAIGNIGSLDQGAITDLQVGVDDQDAGHTAGIYAFDDITFAGIDTSAVRVGQRERYPVSPHISAISTSTYSEHLFVGPGTVADVSLLTANAGDLIRLYDTDTGSSTGSYGAFLVGECNYSSAMPIITGPLAFNRGCLAVITAAGANGARGIVRIDINPEPGYPKSVCYGNDAVLRRYAVASREIRAGNT